MHIACSAVAHAHAEKTPVLLSKRTNKYEKTFFFAAHVIILLLINKYTKHKLMIIRCQSQRLIWHRSESYNVLQSYNENKN